MRQAYLISLNEFGAFIYHAQVSEDQQLFGKVQSSIIVHVEFLKHRLKLFRRHHVVLYFYTVSCGKSAYHALTRACQSARLCRYKEGL